MFDTSSSEKTSPTKKTITLNPALIQRQGITDEGLTSLYAVHERLSELFSRINNEADADEKKRLALNVTSLDYELQDGWKFDRDRRYHIYWYQTPECTCPKDENAALLGSGVVMISEGCPLHDGDQHWHGTFGTIFVARRDNGTFEAKRKL